MTSWMRNAISKLYNAVSAPLAATRNSLAERLQSVRETASLSYNRMIENMEYGRKRLKDRKRSKGRRKRGRATSKR